MTSKKDKHETLNQKNEKQKRVSILNFFLNDINVVKVFEQIYRI